MKLFIKEETDNRFIIYVDMLPYNELKKELRLT